jgi:hypothetical protein
MSYLSYVLAELSVAAHGVERGRLGEQAPQHQ